MGNLPTPNHVPSTVVPCIQVEALCKSHPTPSGQQAAILRDLNLQVHAGESVAIMGTSGAGKSTLLHLLGALDTPDSGSIHINQQPLAALNAEQAAAFRNQQIGFVFQFHHLLMDFNVVENVMMPAWIQNGKTSHKTSSITEKAMALLQEVGLAALAQQRPNVLSGGERQRLAIARCLMNVPSLVIADEPTGSLDETSAKQVQDLLLKLNQERGMTLVLASHSQRLAQAMQRCLWLKGGVLTPHPAH